MTRTINWGILGPGKIARKFALGLKHVPGANLYAVASRTLERAIEFSKELDADKAYGSYQEMLEDPGLDVVYIATPHVFHHSHTLLCLAHKKAVLCEKPFAMNRKEVMEMITMAEKEQVFLMEAMWTHFLPHFRYVADLIKSNIYGSLITMEADFGFKADFNAESRIYNKALGGGSLLDIGIYPVFAALSFFGKPQAIEATASMCQTEVDTSCDITFIYPNDKKIFLSSSTDKKTDTIALITLEKAKIYIKPRFHQPSSVVITTATKTITKDFEVASNGYDFEAAHVQEMILQGRTQSTEMSFSKSLELIDTLDEIREKIGLTY